MKLIIAGSRKLEIDVLDIEYAVDSQNLWVEFVVCGMAKGPDLVGKKWAEGHNIPVIEYPADWSVGKRGGILRNIEMGDAADALLAFWDGKSRGTKHMMDYMEKIGKPVYVELRESV